MKHHCCQWLILPGTIDGDCENFQIPSPFHHWRKTTIAIPSLRSTGQHSQFLRCFEPSPFPYGVSYARIVTGSYRAAGLLKIENPVPEVLKLSGIQINSSLFNTLCLRLCTVYTVCACVCVCVCGSNKICLPVTCSAGPLPLAILDL